MKFDVGEIQQRLSCVPLVHRLFDKAEAMVAKRFKRFVPHSLSRGFAKLPTNALKEVQTFRIC